MGLESNNNWKLNFSESTLKADKQKDKDDLGCTHPHILNYGKKKMKSLFDKDF